ncbi:hypothetical protein P43SY_010650 [Pythium insidiosum]|uniref:Protein kinase domain-containing protein n=1 Tax=Pythium insidiosum TaxID=114742 RepID=A0AAD5L685_PYTIN|nr:hypothetical protein P43SY_010650 [Pythium insidiosum]
MQQNVLTSQGCPSACGGAACVLFSPALSDSLPCVPTGAAGPCASAAVSLGAAGATCDVTFQCLDQVAKNGRWILFAEDNNQREKYVTTPVTAVQRLAYDKALTSVQFTGGVGSTAKTQVKNVAFDDSFFATPPSVETMFVTDVNLRAYLESAKVPKTWKQLALNNVNLDSVPPQLAELNLIYLSLTKNYISSFPDESSPIFKAFSGLTKLYLQDNSLTSFDAKLPAVTDLNLSSNPLSKIPDAIFSMKTLTTLSMRQCNLTNVQLSEQQFTFLDQLRSFDADLTLTSCPSGFAPRVFQRGVGKVCVPGSAASDQGNGSSGSGGSSSSSSSSGLVIGLCVGGGVLLVCAVAFLVYRRRKRAEFVPSNTTGKGGNDSTLYDTGELTEGLVGGAHGGDTYGSSSIWSDPDLLAVRIEYRDVEPIKLLSRGGFGEVWLGLYMNENVAIKRLLSDKKSMSDALAFASEIKTMARLDHPKIVRFIGVAWTNALTIQAVTEFMDCGDLRSLLDSSRASSLTWANLKCQIAIDVADALVYLHTLSPKLIHRDLKSRNVLIDAHSGAKLSDFGISRNRSMEETMTAGVGTARWIAPEVILGGHYTEFADIYSFGVVLSELDTT